MATRMNNPNQEATLRGPLPPPGAPRHPQAETAVRTVRHARFLESVNVVAGFAAQTLLPAPTSSSTAHTSTAPSAATSMADTLIKSTTRHVRLFTARVENGQLVADASQLTLDLDPDNEFLWDASSQEAVQQRFRELVEAHAGADLTDYNLRRIGSELEGTIRQLLQAGQLRYNPDCRVLNYSMGLPQSPATA